MLSSLLKNLRVTLLAIVALAVPAVVLGSDVATARPEGRVADDKATKDDYELDTGGTDAKLKVGGTGSFSLVVKPKNGKKVHPDAPLEVSLKDPKGLKLGKSKLGRNDVVDKASKSPELKTSLRGEKAGTYTVEANVSFFLCTDAWCQRMSDKVAVPVTVE